MLQARRLEKIIENRSAICIEQLDLDAGNIMAAVGLANSGKTLLIRLLCGMLAPSSGKVLLDGQDVHQSPSARARLGVLFQEDLLYDPGDILYATSRDGKTYLRTAAEEATTNLTLQELETRLSGRGFFKAHRAYLVNLQHIKAVIQYTRNSYTLQLNDKQETMIPLSKQSEKELQALLGY
jgi:ABC-type uncharacterized transport system YnjBCD ATPase subunit